jgi:histidinol-phosphate aminotransferase
MDFNRLARPEIVAMKPYVSARNSAAADGILLNANEAPETHVVEPAWQHLALNRYPSPQPAELRSRLAGVYQVEETNLLITRGSDEGIDLLTRVFCRAGRDAIVECSPCFGMYRIAATIQNARVIDVPRQLENGFSIDFDRLTEVVQKNDDIKLVFLTSPNNPTGDLITKTQLESVLVACADKALVVLDEAYIEFCEADSASGLIGQWPNLVVLRTLSKAWAAAGLRCGSVIADPGVIALLQRVIAPYPLASTVVDAAHRSVSAEANLAQQKFVKDIKKRREQFYIFLTGCEVVEAFWKSEANFVLLKVADADGLTQWCAEQGIRIRNFSSQAQLNGCVRVTIGSESELLELTRVLQRYAENIGNEN